MIEQYQRNTQDIDEALKGKPKESDENQKFEILNKKEKEINEFMEKYEVDRKKEEGNLEHLQTTIVAILEHMQKNLNRQTKLPSQN